MYGSSSGFNRTRSTSTNGRPWDLDRTYGGLRIVQPHTGAEGSGWHQGNADAIFRNRKPIRDFAPDLIVVLSADHVYRLDYGEVIDAHLERAAEVTMVTTRVPLAEASRYGTVHVDDQGKVTGFAYKPETPDSAVATTEVFVYNARTLLETLGEIAAKGDGKAGEENGALKDFGDALLPALVQRGHAYAHPLEGYWRDVGTIQSYWASHMDLLGPDPKLNLDGPAWPIFTFGVQRMPARIHQTASIVDSLISPGCIVRGQVERSVLSPGVVVEEGAIVRDTIVFHDTVIGARTVIDRAIVRRTDRRRRTHRRQIFICGWCEHRTGSAGDNARGTGGADRRRGDDQPR
jgi:glucose-1-phosphate adenylyltransferase